MNSAQWSRPANSRTIALSRVPRTAGLCAEPLSEKAARIPRSPNLANPICAGAGDFARPALYFPAISVASNFVGCSEFDHLCIFDGDAKNSRAEKLASFFCGKQCLVGPAICLRAADIGSQAHKPICAIASLASCLCSEYGTYSLSAAEQIPDPWS